MLRYIVNEHLIEEAQQRKLSTSGAFSARSSRHAGLLARSYANSSKPPPPVMGHMVGRRYDIPPRRFCALDVVASEE
jgi:hypothetical protein